MPAKRDWDISKLNGMSPTMDYGPLSPDNVAELYRSVAHLMSDEHRDYLDKFLAGDAKMDALLDLEMFMRLVTIYAIQAVKVAMDENKVTKDIGAILGEVRQSAVSIENMRNKRDELKKVEVKDDDEGMVDTTRVSALSFLEGLDRRSGERG